MLIPNAESWVNEYGDMLYRFAFQRVSNVDVAKDLVQETFLSAWKNKDSFKGDASEKNWLFAILKNKIIDHYRKAANRLTDSMGDTGDSVDGYYFDEEGHWTREASPKDWAIEPSGKIEAKEFYLVLEKCKARLKEIQGMVFSMKYMDEMESEEICKTLNITASNYWVLLHRAKVQLRACLEKNWFA